MEWENNMRKNSKLLFRPLIVVFLFAALGGMRILQFKVTNANSSDYENLKFRALEYRITHPDADWGTEVTLAITGKLKSHDVSIAYLSSNPNLPQNQRILKRLKQRFPPIYFFQDIQTAKIRKKYSVALRSEGMASIKYQQPSVRIRTNYVYYDGRDRWSNSTIYFRRSITDWKWRVNSIIEDNYSTGCSVLN